MKSDRVNIRNDLLVMFLREHRGMENAVSVNEIQKFMAEFGFQVGEKYVAAIITKLKLERKLPICSRKHKGYFWAVRQSEIRTMIDDLASIRDSVQEHIDHLQKYLEPERRIEDTKNHCAICFETIPEGRDLCHNCEKKGWKKI